MNVPRVSPSDCLVWGNCQGAPAVAIAMSRAILLCLLLGLRGLEALLAGAPAVHGPRLRQAAKAGFARSVFLSLRQSGQPTGQQQDGQAPPRPPSLHELVQGADQQLRNGRARQSTASVLRERAGPVAARHTHLLGPALDRMLPLCLRSRDQEPRLAAEARGGGAGLRRTEWHDGRMGHPQQACRA